MKSPKTRTALTKEPCPSCAREFIVGLTMTRNGIRCPHCRATVTLGGPGCLPLQTAEKIATHCRPPAPASGEPRAWEELRLRVEALEQSLENHLRAHHVEERTVPCETLGNDSSSDAGASVAAPLESHSGAKGNANGIGNGNGAHTRPPLPLTGRPRGLVHLVVAVQDSATRERATMIATLFARAGWATEERSAERGPCGVPPGLTLSVSSSVSSADLRNIFEILRQADLQLKLQLHPGPREEETILFIGAAIPEE
jgi:hypothetical protein